VRFTVLASGSAGNASLLEIGSFGLLIDAGLGPRRLAASLAHARASWGRVHAVLLTHTHSDHWNDRTLAHLHRRGVPLYCHPEHAAVLPRWSPSFTALRQANLVHFYEAGQDLLLAPGLRCRPLALRHDGGATFGFRLEGATDLFGDSWGLAYLADLGCWDASLTEALANLDVLALEFNHDLGLEYSSGRSPRLIHRVIGDEGHLSNDQAAGLVREVLRRSAPGRLQHLVQLHLSRDCNRPHLAAAAVAEVIQEVGYPVQVHTSSQGEPGPSLDLNRAAQRSGRRAARRRRVSSPGLFCQSWLPGFAPTSTEVECSGASRRVDPGGA
jgi:ribonuclease BN (tRNA processing enzyme)